MATKPSKLYIDRIHHYMPTSQRLLFLNRAHMVSGPEMDCFVQTFLTNPHKKVVSDRQEIVVY